MKQISLVYISKAAHPFKDKDLEILLAKAREANQKLKITGMLIYREDEFLQVLEGEKESVKMLYGKIQKDARHNNVKILLEENIYARKFDQWSMAFKKLGKNESIDIEGYSNYLRDGFFSAPFNTLGRVALLLELFRKSTK
jgi:hypothetical protein